MLKKSTNKTNDYTGNNSVKLISGGSPFFAELEKLIDQSLKSLHFQFYIFDDDETGTRVAETLVRAARRGVQIYVLLDGYASRSLKDETILMLEDAGVHFRWFQPLFSGNNFFIGRRMHHKVVVADARHSLVSGVNISNRYNDMPDEPAWLDWAASASGEVSLQLHNLCVQMWFKRPPLQSHPNVSMAGIGQCQIRVRVNDWARNKNEISRSYIEMFRNAQTNITIMSSYFLPGRLFRKNLLLAAKRGIHIKIILTKVSDIFIAKQAEKFFYPWLLKRNIEIYEYRKKVLHGKMATCDGQWVTVGSYNFNDLSTYASVELNLDVKDAEFSQSTDDALERIMNEDCDKITKESLEQQTYWWHKFFYRVAYALSRLMLVVFTFRFTHGGIRRYK
ncbi:MAG: phospholipase D-like domain-containing protein [Chryseolinea sp.]